MVERSMSLDTLPTFICRTQILPLLYVPGITDALMALRRTCSRFWAMIDIPMIKHLASLVRCITILRADRPGRMVATTLDEAFLLLQSADKSYRYLVLLPPGQFSTDRPWISQGLQVEIRGASRSETIITLKSISVDAIQLVTLTQSKPLDIRARNCRVISCTIEHRSPNNYSFSRLIASETIVRDCHFARSGLEIRPTCNSSIVTVEGNHFDKTDIGGVHIFGNEPTTPFIYQIKDNHFDHRRTAMSIRMPAHVGDIQGNRFTNCITVVCHHQANICLFRDNDFGEAHLSEYYDSPYADLLYLEGNHSSDPEWNINTRDKPKSRSEQNDTHPLRRSLYEPSVARRPNVGNY